MVLKGNGLFDGVDIFFTISEPESTDTIVETFAPRYPNGKIKPEM